MNNRAVISLFILPGVLITVIFLLAISYTRMRHEQRNVVDLLILERGDGKNTEASVEGSELKNLNQDVQAEPKVANQYQSDETLFERHLAKEPPPTPSKTTRKTSTEVRLSQPKSRRHPSGGIPRIKINDHDIQIDSSDTDEPGQITPTPQSRRSKRMKEAAETMAMLSNPASPAIKVEDTATCEARYMLPHPTMNDKRGQDWVAQSLRDLVDASESHAEADDDTIAPAPGGLTDDKEHAQSWRKQYRSQPNLVAESIKSKGEAEMETVNGSKERPTEKGRSRVSFLRYIKKSIESREKAFWKMRGRARSEDVEKGAKLGEVASSLRQE